MMYIILIIIILLIVIIYCYKHKEYFITNNQPNSIDSLDYQIINNLDEAFEILTNENYLLSFNKSDLYARDIIPPNQDTYKKIIKHKIKEISSSEDKAFRWMINSFKELYPAIVKSSKSSIWNQYLCDFKIIKGDQIDERMPHTHLKTIIFDVEYFKELVNNHRKNEINLMLMEQSETLIHEMGHLLERNNPTINNFFQDVYLELGFLPIASEQFINIVPDKFRFRIRSNPDELPNLQYYWWKKNPDDLEFYLPLALYTSDKPKYLTDTEMSLLIFKEDNGKYIYQKKIKIEDSEYYNFLGITNNNYHPKEIVPEYLAMWYLSIVEGGSLGLDMSSKGFKIFEKMVQKTFPI